MPGKISLGAAKNDVLPAKIAGHQAGHVRHLTNAHSQIDVAVEQGGLCGRGGNGIAKMRPVAA
jgi:hypothetical protein